MSDSLGFWIPDSGFQYLSAVDLIDSGWQSQVGFRISWAASRIRKFCISHSTSKIYSDCGLRNPDSLTWRETSRQPRMGEFWSITGALYPGFFGGGGGGVIGLIFAWYVPLASQSPYPIIVHSVGRCNFRDPNLVTFYLCIYLINPLNRSS